MNHTPTPWKTTFDEFGGYDCMSAAWDISPADDPLALSITVLDCRTLDNRNSELAEANAAFIVKAVNSHEKMEAFIREVATHADGPLFAKAARLLKELE